MSGQEVQLQKQIRVLVSKLGLDGHDRGALVNVERLGTQV